MIRFFSQHPFLVGSTLLSLVAIGIYAYPSSQQEKNPQYVVTTKVGISDISDDISFSGIVQPLIEVDVSAQTSGRVSSMNVSVGDEVRAGEVLAELDGSVEKATVRSLENNLSAITKTVLSINELYDERIKSAEESVSLVKQPTVTSTSSLNNTKAVSLLTSTAILTSQVADTLGELLSLRNGIRNYKDVPYYDSLGSTRFSSRSQAEDSLMVYQKEQQAYQQFFTTSILNAQPSPETVTQGFVFSKKVLESAKIALNDSYTMLLYTRETDTLSLSQIDVHKTTLTTLGSSVESSLDRVRASESEITQTELALSTLKKEKDSKLTEARAQATQVEGQMAVSETAVRNSIIQAPFDGVVTKKIVDSGSVTSFGSPVYHLVQDSVVKVVVGVPDDFADFVHRNDEGFVSVDGYDETIPAVVTKIYPVRDPRTHKVTIELEINNDKHLLKTGSIVSVLLPRTISKNSLLLPKSALISRYGLQYVFVAVDGKVTRKNVRVGIQTDSSVEILSGVSQGDVVVKEGGQYLRNGDLVTVSSSTYHVTQ